MICTRSTFSRFINVSLYTFLFIRFSLNPYDDQVHYAQLPVVLIKDLIHLSKINVSRVFYYMFHRLDSQNLGFNVSRETYILWFICIVMQCFT